MFDDDDSFTLIDAYRYGRYRAFRDLLAELPEFAVGPAWDTARSLLEASAQEELLNMPELLRGEAIANDFRRSIPDGI